MWVFSQRAFCTATFERIRPPVNIGKLIAGPAAKKFPIDRERSWSCVACLPADPHKVHLGKDSALAALTLAAAPAISSSARRTSRDGFHRDDASPTGTSRVTNRPP